MATNRLDEIRELLRSQKKVYVNELSSRYSVSEVSIRKYLARLAEEGIASRFYGGAALVEEERPGGPADRIYDDPVRTALARAAREYIADGDSIFLGSGMTCCILARELKGFSNLTVFTNNITALPDLFHNGARVYLIGGEVASTDKETLFSSWDSPHAQLDHIFVNKAFTSISGLDLKAGLTVDSIVSTRIFSQIPRMAHRWYLIADSTKFDKISIYPVADLDRIHTLITDRVPDHYVEPLRTVNLRTV
ncbi:MAG: DeoR/GlpR family DNA-binding transcription regulator [Alkalispirochaeta sp.]